jgi:hypothetical protein
MLYFALRSQQAHRRHVRPTRRPGGFGQGSGRSGPTPHTNPTPRNAQGRGVARQAGRGRIHRAIHRVPEARGGESAAADTRTRRGGTETASRTPQPLHNDTLCTSHASHSSRARQHSFRTRDAHEDTAHTKGSTRAASGLWGSPSPPRGTIAHPRSSPTAQPLDFDRAVPGAKLTNRPTSRAARPRPRTLPHTCPLWTHRTTSTSHPLPAATRSATQPHIAHTRPAQERRVATDSSHFVTSSLRPLRQRRAATDSSHFVTSSTLSLQLVASLGLP